jgi:hypothetical protein
MVWRQGLEDATGGVTDGCSSFADARQGAIDDLKAHLSLPELKPLCPRDGKDALAVRRLEVTISSSFSADAARGLGGAGGFSNPGLPVGLPDELERRRQSAFFSP